jgi:hypothetical protein
MYLLIIYCQLGGPLDLFDIMKHPIAMEILKDHAMASRNGEQIAFYSDVLMFKSVHTERPFHLPTLPKKHLPINGLLFSCGRRIEPSPLMTYWQRTL